MNWDDLRYALAVARTGTLNGAASLLGVNQSTVGRRLTALESRLGVPLFTRSKQGMMPTDAGRLVAAKAAEIEFRTEALAEAMHSAGNDPAGEVRILGNDWTIRRLIAVGMDDLLKAYPRLPGRTVAGRPGASLWRGEPGLGLWFEARAIDGAFSLPLGQVSYAVYRLRGKETRDWVAYFDEERAEGGFHETSAALRGDRAAPRLTALDAGALHCAISNGIGQGLLPVVIGDGDPALERAPGYGVIDRELFCHLHPDNLGAPRIQVLLSWIRGHFDEAFSPGAGGAAATA